jgi:hypothetical protein
MIARGKALSVSRNNCAVFRLDGEQFAGPCRRLGYKWWGSQAADKLLLIAMLMSCELLETIALHGAHNRTQPTAI